MICKYCGKTTGSFVCEYCGKDNRFPLRGNELEKLLEKKRSIDLDESMIKPEAPEPSITDKAATIHTSDEGLKSAYRQGYTEGYQIGFKEGYSRGLNQGYNNGKSEAEQKNKIPPSDSPKSKLKKPWLIFGVLCLLGTLAGGVIGGMIERSYCAFHPVRIKTTYEDENDQPVSSITSTPELIKESDTSDISEMLTDYLNPSVNDEGRENAPSITDETNTDDMSLHITQGENYEM